MRQWQTPGDAFQQGFRDGYLGIDDTPVERFHESYEVGQISGMAESRRSLAGALDAKRAAKVADPSEKRTSDAR